MSSMEKGPPKAAASKKEEHPYAAIVGDVPFGQKVEPHPYAAIVGGADIETPEKPNQDDDIYHMVTEGMDNEPSKLASTKPEDDIYHMVTEGMDDEPGSKTPATTETGQVKSVPELGPPPVLPGQADWQAHEVFKDMRTDEEVLKGMATDQEEFEARAKGTDKKPTPLDAPKPESADTTVRPERFAAPENVPSPEEQERHMTRLTELREKLVKIEQDDYAKFAYADTGDYHEMHKQALAEYDRARAEYVNGDIGHYAQEQFELMKKRGEGTPGTFERCVANSDKFLRKKILPGVTLKAAVGGALFGLGFVFPPAWGARQLFAGGGSFVASYEWMRKKSLDGGMFGLITGIKKEALAGDLDKLGPRELEQRMAAITAYARVQGYWDDVEESYRTLNDVHRAKYEAAARASGMTPEEIKRNVAAYSSEAVEVSREDFEKREAVEKKRKAGRTVAAVGLGALAGGLISRLFGGQTAEVPAEHTPTPGNPRLDDPLEGLGRESVVPPVEDTPLVDNVPTPGNPRLDDPLEGLGRESVDNVPTPESSRLDLEGIPSAPPAEIYRYVVDYIPAAHGLRPEYYDLIKDKPVTDFLGRKMFSFSSDTQYPFPETDGEYPWIKQAGIAHNRMMDYSHLQDKMRAAWNKLDDDYLREHSQKLSVADFLKKVMGRSQMIPRRVPN